MNSITFNTALSIGLVSIMVGVALLLVAGIALQLLRSGYKIRS